MKREKREQRVFKKLTDVEKVYLPNLERKRRAVEKQEPNESARETVDRFKNSLCEQYGLKC